MEIRYRGLSPGCQGVLERIGRDLSEVDLIIPHQANLRIVEAGMENLGLPMDKTFTNLQRYGNTAGASVPIALREAVDEGLVNSGDLIVTAAFGGGLRGARMHSYGRRKWEYRWAGLFIRPTMGTYDEAHRSITSNTDANFGGGFHEQWILDGQ